MKFVKFIYLVCRTNPRMLVVPARKLPIPRNPRINRLRRKNLINVQESIMYSTQFEEKSSNILQFLIMSFVFIKNFWQREITKIAHKIYKFPKQNFRCDVNYNYIFKATTTLAKKTNWACTKLEICHSKLDLKLPLL